MGPVVGIWTGVGEAGSRVLFGTEQVSELRQIDMYPSHQTLTCLLSRDITVSLHHQRG